MCSSVACSIARWREPELGAKVLSVGVLVCAQQCVVGVNSETETELSFVIQEQRSYYRMQCCMYSGSNVGRASKPSPGWTIRERGGKDQAGS